MQVIRKNIYYYFFFSCLLFLLGSCEQNPKNSFKAINGEIDLREWKTKDGPVALDGEWLFTPNSVSDDYTQPKKYIQVPADWNSLPNQKYSNIRHARYLVKVLLPKGQHELVFRVEGVSTAYEFYINEKKQASLGKLGQKLETTKPRYANKIIPINTEDSILIVEVDVANFHHYKSGLFESIILGEQNNIIEQSKTRSIFGGILMGIFFLSMFLYLLLYLFMKKEKYFLYYSLISLMGFLHFLCLSNRILYEFLGANHWSWAYKVELGTFYFGLMFVLLFYSNFFQDLISKKLLMLGCIVLSMEGLYTLIFPAPYFTYIDYLIPYNLLGVIICLLIIFIRAIHFQREGAMIISGLNIFIFGAFIQQELMTNNQIHELKTIHIASLIYTVGINIVLIKRISSVYFNEKKWRTDLEAAKLKLEHQNKNLEEIVSRRTSQLIDSEKQAHDLKLEKAQRDLDILASNNQLKLQYSKNLMDELERLSSTSDVNLRSNLNIIIAKLKGQSTTEEKLNVLQQDMDRVNAEFHERLSAKYPQLSKTERELCAYIKLNLSSKEIAELRKTTLNTINVTRSRIRAKLNLGRDVELESFIQQF